jgi:hypothetical protein
MHCIYCGTTLPDVAAYCGKCGKARHSLQQTVENVAPFGVASSGERKVDKEIVVAASDDWPLPANQLSPLDDHTLLVMCPRCNRAVPLPVILMHLLNSDGERGKPLKDVFAKIGNRLRCSNCRRRGAVLLKLLPEVASAPQRGDVVRPTREARDSPTDHYAFFDDSPADFDHDEVTSPEDQFSEFAYYDSDADEWVEPGDDDEDFDDDETEFDDRDDWS